MSQRQRQRRTAAILPRARWIAIGREVKAIRDVVQDLAFPVGGPPRWQEARDRLESVALRIERIRDKLDDLVCVQHPDWPDATHVFYGPDTPSTRPRKDASHA